MAKLVLFLQTDASAKEKLTSTSLVEPKHLQHLPPFIIFAAKITIKIIGIWKDSFFRDCRCISIRRRLPGKKQKDWFRMGFWYLTYQCGDWPHCRIVL